MSDVRSWTAPTMTPVATAKTAGSTERSTVRAHQASVSGVSARGRDAKNIHS